MAEFLSSNGTCILDEYKFEPGTDNLTAYDASDITQQVHDNSPRFGRSSNITGLILGSKEDGKDYAIGVLAGSIAIAIFLVVWAFAICGCTIAGPKRVGMLSGRQVAPAPKPEKNSGLKTGEDNIEPSNETDEDAEYTEALETWKEKARKQERRLNIIRVVVLLCSLGIVICAIIMITKGVKNLANAGDSTLDGVAHAQGLTNEAVTLVENMITFQNVTLSALTSFSDLICPAAAEICANLTEGDPACDFNFSAIPYGDELKTVIESQQQLVVKDLTKFQSDLVEFGNVLEDIDSQVSKFHWAFYVAAVFAGLLAVLNLLIITGVIAAWRKKKSNWVRTSLKIIRSWFLVPIFGFLVLLSWIFSMVFVIGSTVAADYCVNDPDQLTSAVLVKYGDFLDTVILDFLLFYIRGCPVDKAPLGLRNEVNDLQTVLGEATAFVNDLFASDAIGELQAVCGTDPSIINQTATIFRGTICGMEKLLLDTIYFFRCSNWRPLYRLVVYDAVCYQGNDGFYYVSVTQFVIVVLALVMLTLRVAFKELNVLDSEDEEQEVAVTTEGQPVGLNEDDGPSDEEAEKVKDDGVINAEEEGPKATVY